MEKGGFYKNGQKISEQSGDILTYYFKSGKKKAEGRCVNELFEGKWLFYNEDGQLLQEGNFFQNQKDGEWKRFNKNGNLEYHVDFKGGKEIKKYK